MKRGAGECPSSFQIEDVPNEIWQVIFTHLPPSFLGVARQVSIGWYTLIQDLSRQSLDCYFSYLINHPDYQARPLNLFIQEYQRYQQSFSYIPMNAILSILQGNTESIVSEVSPTSQKTLYGLRFARGYPLPEKGLSEENILDIKGWAIFFAAWQGNTQLLDKLLILQEIDMRYKDIAFLSASRSRHTEIIAKLVAHGVYVNTAHPKHDRTATYIAAREGHVEVIDQLAKLGANVNISDDDGITPIYIAAWEGRVDVIVKLAELGADVNMSRDDGTTPIFVAAQNGHVEAIAKLIELDADVNRPNNHGETPICIAAWKGHVEAIAEFIKHGADVNLAMNDGATLIFIAAQEGHAEVVQFLLKQNVHIQAYISSVKSLSDFAQSCDNRVIDRMDQFIEKKIQEGNDIEKIPLLPSEIAYIMGHDEIVNMFKTFNNANHNEVVTIIGSHPCSQSSPITFVFDAKKDNSSSSGEENSMEIEENNQEQTFLSRYYYG